MGAGAGPGAMPNPEPSQTTDAHHDPRSESPTDAIPRGRATGPTHANTVPRAAERRGGDPAKDEEAGKPTTRTEGRRTGQGAGCRAPRRDRCRDETVGGEVGAGAGVAAMPSRVALCSAMPQEASAEVIELLLLLLLPHCGRRVVRLTTAEATTVAGALR